MKFHRNTIWLIPLAFFISFPLWSIPLGKFLTPRGGFDPDINKESADLQNFTMQTVTILQNQNGKDTAVINATKARTNPDNLDIVILDKVNAKIFDDQGQVTLITSQRGEYSMAGRVLVLIQDVVLNKVHDKQFMYTDELVYENYQSTIKCPGKTRVKNETAEITGGTFDYDINTKSYAFGKRVKCVINGFIEP